MLKTALIMVLVGACVAKPNAIVDKRQTNSTSSYSSNYDSGSNSSSHGGGSSSSSYGGYDSTAYSGNYSSYAYSGTYNYNPTTYHDYELGASEEPATIRYPEKEEGANETWYGNNEHVEILIEAPQNPEEGIRLILKWYDIEVHHHCTWDRVAITSSGMWMERCGASSEELDLGVLSGDIRITFTSDSSVTGTGFEFSYQAESLPPKP